MGTFAGLSADVAAVGGIDYTNEQTTADRWTKGGLRLITRAGPWPWLQAADSWALTAGDYDYAFSALASDIFQLDTRSFRYGDSSTYLTWGSLQAIDEVLGPDWKEAASADWGTPEYVTRVGNEVWIAKRPSATFVTDNPTIYFLYYRQEVSTGTLYLPDEYYEIAIDAALAFGFTQEDDPRAESLMARVMRIHLPEMRGSKLDIGNRDQMALPRWVRAAEVALDDYGDGGWARG